MGFKKLSEYNEERYGNKFILKDDGDSAEVVFLYRNYKDDVMVAPSHYVKSANYNGYVFCNGKGCPACAKGIRIQHKLFIPLYVVKRGKEAVDSDHIEFFDRTVKFDAQLQRDVFHNYPNPSDFIFKIIRHGEPNSIDTNYEIRAVAQNNLISYDEILKKCHITMPEGYEDIIKEVSNSELYEMVNNEETSESNQSLPSYKITPRKMANIPNFDDVVAEESEEIEEAPDFE